jgi:hypothetical protein
MLYSFGKYRIASSTNLHPLVPCSGDEADADFAFVLENAVQPLLVGIEWTVDYKLANGNVFFSAGQRGTEHFLNFHDYAVFMISLERAKIHAYPKTNLPEHTISHLLIDQVLPRSFSLQAEIFIHASAVCVGNGLAVFLGDSGRGKSTLALSFHQRGYPAFTDDVLLLEDSAKGMYGHAVYPALRLWQDSVREFLPTSSPKEAISHYSSKLRVPTDEVFTAMPLTALFLLDKVSDTPEITLRPLSSQEAFVALLKGTFHFHKPSRALHEKEFDTFSKLISTKPIFLLQYPRQYGVLDEVHSHILGLTKQPYQPLPS